MTKKKRKYNTRLIKQTLSYSTQEIAGLFGLHKRTVQEWYAQGLPRIDDRKPFLVRGANLKEFLDTRQGNRKRRCQPNEFYCFKCRGPHASWENVIDIKFLNEKRLLLAGLCVQCTMPVYKFASVRKFEELQKTFVVLQIHNKHLLEFNPSIYNTDKKGVAGT